MKRIFYVVLIMFVASSCYAGLFDFGRKEEKKEEQQAPKMIKRYHLTVPDKATERELLQLFNARRSLLTDTMVLQRLLKDRKSRYMALQESMKTEFGILPENLYEYDHEKRTIYLISEGGEDQKSDKKTPRRIHKQFKEEADANRFLEMQTKRSQRSEAIRVLSRILEEQKETLARVDKLLKDKYAVETGKMYDYDPEKMKLYEVMRTGVKQR